MGSCELFFDGAVAGTPYCCEAELREDVMTVADALLYTAFDYRNLWQERLEMRGVVITPQEFESALCERMLKGREQENARKDEVKREFKNIRRHMESRILAGEAAFWGFRFAKAVKSCGLTPPEWLCYLLAAVVEWDRKYERLYGYLQDNVAARLPTVGLGLAIYRLGHPEEEAHIREDSPLWRFLFTDVPSQGTGESELSRQMKLRKPVIAWLQRETVGEAAPREAVFREAAPRHPAFLPEQLSAMVWEESGFLTVDLAEVYALEKEGAGKAGELLGTAVWLAGLEDKRLKKELRLTGGRGIEWRQWKKTAGLLDRWGVLYRRTNRTGMTEPGMGTVLLKPVFTWDDLILEESGTSQLKQLCSRVKYRRVVREEWGFGRKSPYGNGVSALFYGPPGTGKTMAAQVVASELGVDLCKVDLAGLVSKYIGETEKNMSRVFDDAAESGCVLFFDEADSLFAKRSAVSDSNDRYANMETGYLLQKFEEYEGVCILATNCFYNMDDAFKRRITDMIRFSFPSEETRKRLWKSMIPETARVDEELELFMFAARFELSGSAIKEVVTGAAYRAARNGRGILNEDLRESLKSHYLKYGKTLSDHELEA